MKHDVNYYILKTRGNKFTIIRENKQSNTLIGFLCSLLEGKYNYYSLKGKDISEVDFKYEDSFNSIENFAKVPPKYLKCFESYEEAYDFLKRYLSKVKKELAEEELFLYNNDIIDIQLINIDLRGKVKNG